MADPARNWRVLVDINVILDVLLRREPFFDDSARIWVLAETGQIEATLAAHSFTTLYFLYSRQEGNVIAQQNLRKILKVFEVARVDRSTLETACDLEWDDFEDAVQMSAAVESGCQYLVTRNPRDYQGGSLPAIQPADFLAIWAASA